MAEAVVRLSSRELEYRIANGMAGTPMPPFIGTLSEPERWDLVAYLRHRFAE
jgi:mono/diheme cytochrome c family protein